LFWLGSSLYACFGAKMRFLLYLWAILVSACQFPDPPPGPVSLALKEELRIKKVTSIDLVTLTKFEWDELFLFSPYQPTQDVCRELVLSEESCSRTIRVQSNDDGEMLMVFRKNGAIVHVEMHHRFHGDFSPTKQGQVISPRNGRYQVTQTSTTSSGAPWLQLNQINGR
jgi:hypothetical protein